MGLLESADFLLTALLLLSFGFFCRMHDKPTPAMAEEFPRPSQERVKMFMVMRRHRFKHIGKV
jgi:hypothetical protein